MPRGTSWPTCYLCLLLTTPGSSTTTQPPLYLSSYLPCCIARLPHLSVPPPLLACTFGTGSFTSCLPCIKKHRLHTCRCACSLLLPHYLPSCLHTIIFLPVLPPPLTFLFPLCLPHAHLEECAGRQATAAHLLTYLPHPTYCLTSGGQAVGMGVGGWLQNDILAPRSAYLSPRSGILPALRASRLCLRCTGGDRRAPSLLCWHALHRNTVLLPYWLRAFGGPSRVTATPALHGAALRKRARFHAAARSAMTRLAAGGRGLGGRGRARHGRHGG